VTLRTFAATTLVVLLLLGAGWAAGSMRIAAARAQYDATEVLARALVPTSRDAAVLERTLHDARLHVAVEDRGTGYVYEWENGTPVPHSLPPVPNGAPPPGAQAPGAGPPGQPPRPRTLLSQFAGATLGRAPIRIEGATLAVILAPDVDALGSFLLVDLVLTLFSVAFAICACVWIVSGFSRAERRRLERTIEERRVAAAEFQRFLADAGHELRTPLTIVSGYVEILSNELERSEMGARILEGLQAETARMRALVEKMLLLARLESPVSVPRLVDVGNVAKDVIAQMQARFPGRELVLVASERASIVIDHDDLYEALRNLIENALRYAPASPVEIAIVPDAQTASIAVTDHGTGIPAHEQKKIFDRFYRGSAQADAEGSGLGLAIVARVAARWNGLVHVTSTPGDTMFKLQFPLAEEV
jgi:signal transduction histidine kinase